MVLRCGVIGSVLGSIPGIGASVVDWVAYGHAARTEKDAQKTFGKGDIRGVIASESSNNAKEGGALISTIAFGVPATAGMALLLGAFLIIQQNIFFFQFQYFHFHNFLVFQETNLNKFS